MADSLVQAREEGDRPERGIWELVDPLPKQRLFYRRSLEYRYLLFGGARGPGKSRTLRWGLVWRLLRWFSEGIPDVKVGLFCEDYPSLKDRQIGKIRTEFPDWLGQVKNTQTDGLGFYLDEDYGSGVILLRNLDDPAKYQSAEFAGIAVDELTKNTKETFDTLRGSLRWPDVPDTFFWGATNPGGVGHIWVKNFWIDGVFPDEMQRIADQFHYVPALPADNPYLTESYWDELRSQPPEIQRAWIHGDWDVFSGQYFRTLRRDIHAFDPSTDLPDSWVNWPRYRSWDWGYAAPSSIGWWAVDPDGNPWRYRELYQRGMETEDFIEKALSLETDRERKLVEFTVAGSELWDASQGPSIAERAWKADLPLIQAEKKRVPGWDLMRRYINPSTVPMLRVSITCKDWWRTVPALVHDERRVEDVDKDGEDHAAEETRYFLMSRPEPEFVEAPKLEDRFEPGSPSWHAARHVREMQERSERASRPATSGANPDDFTGQVMPDGPGYEDPLFGDQW